MLMRDALRVLLQVAFAKPTCSHEGMRKNIVTPFLPHFFEELLWHRE